MVAAVVPGQGGVAEVAEPVEQARPGPDVVGDEQRGVESDVQGSRGRWSGCELDHAVVHLQPAALGHRLRRGFRTPMHPHPEQARLEERWGQHRRRQHDQQHRGIEVVAEHPLLQADRGEDQADLTPGDHPEPDEPLVARRPEDPERRHELPDHRDHEEHGRDAEHIGREELADVDRDPDLEEEHGDEQVADRRELPLDAVLHLAARERDAGDERADDRGELRRLCELGEPEREREGQRHQGARGSRAFVQPLERGRRDLRADQGRDHEEAHCHADDLEQARDRDRPLRDHPDARR